MDRMKPKLIELVVVPSSSINDETYGETRGLMVAETYGADRLWCLLKPIPVELDSDSETSEPPELPTTEDETV